MAVAVMVTMGAVAVPPRPVTMVVVMMIMAMMVIVVMVMPVIRAGFVGVSVVRHGPYIPPSGRGINHPRRASSRPSAWAWIAFNRAPQSAASLSRSSSRPAA